MPLTLAPADEQLKIVKILADEKTKKHLENLGITVNSNLKVLTHGGGNVICSVKDGRLALDGDIASKILVAAT